MLAARPRALTTYLHINPMRNLRIFTDEDLVTCFKLHNSPDSNSCSCFSVLFYSLTSDYLAPTVKNLPAMQETQVQSLVGKMPWRREWQPTPVLLPGESHWKEEPGGLQSMAS